MDEKLIKTHAKNYTTREFRAFCMGKYLNKALVMGLFPETLTDTTLLFYIEYMHRPDVLPADRDMVTRLAALFLKLFVPAEAWPEN